MTLHFNTIWEAESFQVPQQDPSGCWAGLIFVLHVAWGHSRIVLKFSIFPWPWGNVGLLIPSQWSCSPFKGYSCFPLKTLQVFCLFFLWPFLFVWFLVLFFFSGVLCCWRSPCLLQPPLWALYSANLCSFALERFLGVALAPHSPRAQGLPAGEGPEQGKAWREGTLWKASVFSPTVRAQSKVWCLWWMSSWAIDAFFHAVSRVHASPGMTTAGNACFFHFSFKQQNALCKGNLVTLSAMQATHRALRQSQGCWGPCVYFPQDH